MTEDEIKEVKLAWANGEVVQVYLDFLDKWSDWDDKRSIHLSDTGKWRVKPETISINGYEVPKPLTIGDNICVYWLISLDSTELCLPIDYDGDETDRVWIELGICHSTKEAAQVHARALLSFTEKG